jgi:hypothetical protein
VTDKWKRVAVDSLPYFSVVSNKRSYPACYYHLKINNYEFRAGSFINIFLESSVDVDFRVFGGRSLTNASIALNVGTNSSLKMGQLISVDAGTEAVILVTPKDWKFSPVSFEFKYAVTGD